jgi:hypothetical protein
MGTPISSATAYCTPTQLLEFFDARQIGDLISDKGLRVSDMAIQFDPNVQAALQAASGEVEAACGVAGRYSPTDLAGLTGNSAVLLQEMVAALAYGRLQRRRFPDKEVPESVKEARAMLGQLREGVMVFGIKENQDAGNFDNPALFLDVATIQRVGLATYTAQRMYGQRNDIARIWGAQGDPGYPPYYR